MREAELILRGAAARDALDGSCRTALRTLIRDGRLPDGPDAVLDLDLVDRWVRQGMLVEALAVLEGAELGGPAREWADLLGELLAPVPAHAEGAFVDMHRSLLSGGASVALAILEDRCRQGPVPAWAARRLSLLRWMLLDNALTAAEDAPTGEAPSELAAALRKPLAARNIEAMRAAAEHFATLHPESVDARDVLRMLDALVYEMNSQLGDIELSVQTVPVFGRPAAAMQLRMASFEGAFNIYRKLTTQHPGDIGIHELFDAVRGVQRVLEGRAPVDRTFPPPPREELGVALGISPAYAEREDAREARRIVESSQGGLPLDPFTDETRPVSQGELPLAAFRDDETQVRPIEPDPEEFASEATKVEVDTDKIDMKEVPEEAFETFREGELPDVGQPQPVTPDDATVIVQPIKGIGDDS
ncbi:MAG: hypothetical protein AAGE52_17355 [Myxococcota bacterium]